MISESLSFTVALVLLLIVLFFLFEEIWKFSLFSRRSGHRAVTNLSTLSSLALVKHHEGIVAIDVRPRASYLKSHLPNARNAPYEKGEIDATDIQSLDPDTPILIYCAGGSRSRYALGAVIEFGFTRIFHMNRGLILWRLFGGPTESGDPARKGENDQVSG